MASFEAKWETINVDGVRMSIQVSSGNSYNNGVANLTLDADDMSRLIIFLKRSRAMLIAVKASKNLPIKEQDDREVLETEQRVRNIIVEQQT